MQRMLLFLNINGDFKPLCLECWIPFNEKMKTNSTKTQICKRNAYEIYWTSDTYARKVMNFNHRKNLLRIDSIALQTLRSSTRASAELWNVKPNRLLHVHQWWNVGFAFVYCRSFIKGQLSTTLHKHNNIPLKSTLHLKVPFKPYG